MSYRLKNVLSVDAYLQKGFPNDFTINEICEALRMCDNTAQRAIKSLISRGTVELVGKRGRSNLYRYKQN